MPGSHNPGPCVQRGRAGVPDGAPSQRLPELISYRDQPGVPLATDNRRQPNGRAQCHRHRPTRLTLGPLHRRSTLVAQLSGKQHPTPHRQHKAAPTGEPEPPVRRHPDSRPTDQGLRAIGRLHARWSQPALVTECHPVLGPTSRKTPIIRFSATQQAQRKASADPPVRRGPSVPRVGNIANRCISGAANAAIRR